MLRDDVELESSLDDEEERCVEEWVVCRVCDHRLARVTDRIPDSEGLGIHGGAFVNPHGYLHTLAPYLSTPGAQIMGRFHAQDSWFQGYDWAMAHCGRCATHLGWCFESVGGQPVRFWGLRLDAIRRS